MVRDKQKAGKTGAKPKPVEQEKQDSAAGRMEKKPLSGRQKLMLVGFGFIAAGVLVLLLELVLMIAGVGKADPYRDPYLGFVPGDTLYEKRVSSNGDDVYGTRENKIRWFNEQQFAALKPKGTYRVFTLGGSSTYGRPYNWKTSFSNWLDISLNALEEPRDYEVINAGGISYASYRVVVLMKELVKYEPDLLVVYTGHNEFLEDRTYSEVRDQNPLLRKAESVLGGLRTFNLLKDAATGAGKTNDTDGGLARDVKTRLDVWSGLETYARDDKQRTAILDHFRFNIAQMIQIAEDNGIPIIFVNPAANVKDFSPFKSQHRDGLDGSSKQAFKAHFDQGMIELRNGNHQAALGSFEQALALDDRYADLHYRLGHCYLELGDLVSASKHFGKALTEDVCPLRILPAEQEILAEVTGQFNVPLVDLDADLKRESIETYGHAVLGDAFFLDHVHPNIKVHQRIAWLVVSYMKDAGMLVSPLDWRAHEALYTAFMEGIDTAYYAEGDKNLGKVLGWAGKIEEAGAAMARALRRGDPNDPELHYNMGIIQEKEGKLNLAAASYLKVVKLSPGFFEGQFNLGKVYQKLSRYDEALAAFDKALKIDPAHAETYYSRGVTLGDLGRFEDAVAALEKARQINPRFPDIDRQLGYVYQKWGKPDQAMRALDRHYAVNPQPARAALDLGITYGKKGDAPEAIKNLKRALEIDPNLSEAHHELGMIYQALNQPEEAEKAFLEVVRLQPEHFQSWFDLGIFYHNRNQFDDAISAYKQAIERKPDFVAVYNNLGAVYGKTRQFQGAIQAFRKTIELDPTAGDAHYNLANLLLYTGQPEEAVTHFNRARDLGIQVPEQVWDRLKPYLNDN